MIYHALQHKTSKRYVSAHPALGVHVEAPDHLEAVGWTTKQEAELWRASLGELGEFADCWAVVPIERYSTYDVITCPDCGAKWTITKGHTCPTQNTSPVSVPFFPVINKPPAATSAKRRGLKETK